MPRKNEPADAFGPDKLDIDLSHSVALLAARLGVPEIVGTNGRPYEPDILVSACLKVTEELATLQRELDRCATELETRTKALDAREKAVRWREERLAASDLMLKALEPKRPPAGSPAAPETPSQPIPAPRRGILAAVTRSIF